MTEAKVRPIGMLPRLDEFEQCPLCAVGGAEPIECDVCAGRGIHECRTCHEEHSCGECAGTGKDRNPLEECELCGGSQNIIDRCFTLSAEQRDRIRRGDSKDRTPPAEYGCGGRGLVVAGPGKLADCPRCQGEQPARPGTWTRDGLRWAV